jgi:hypothetical protein
MLIEDARKRGLIHWTDLTDRHGPVGPVDLAISERKWADSRDSLSALDVFLLCEAMEVYPPLSVIKWLADALEKYLLGNGKPGLDKLLGLVNAKGKKPKIAAIRAARKLDAALYTACRLVHVERFTAAEAARRVAPEHGYQPKTIERAIGKYTKDLKASGVDICDIFPELKNRSIHLLK